jgi:WD40 repeat protein
MNTRAGAFESSPDRGRDSSLRRGTFIALAACGLVAQEARGEKPQPREWRLSDAHANSVTSLAYALDGSTLASASRDETVKLWDLVTGRVRATFRGQSGPVVSLAFEPGGKLLATAAETLDRGPDGRVIAAKGHEIKIWGVTTGQEKRTIEHRAAEVRSLTFSPDGARLATIDGEARARIWDVATGALQAAVGLPTPASRAAISADLTTLAVSPGGMDHSVILIEVATGKLLTTLAGSEAPIGSLAFSPDRTKLVAGAGPPMHGRTPANLPSEVRIWSLHLGAPKEGKVLGHLTGFVPVVAFSPDGRRLVAGGGDESMLKIWDVATEEERTIFSPTIRHIRAVAFSPDGASLAVGGVDSSIAIHDADTGRERTQLSGRSASCLAFFPGDKTLAAGLDDGTVALWDVDAGRVRKAFPGAGSRITALAVSANGKWLAAGGPRGGRWAANLAIWSLDSDEGTVLSRGHGGTITALAFSPDSKTLAVARDDGTIDRLARPLFVGTRPPLKAHAGRVRGLAYSPDGKSLGSVGEDGAIRIWDAVDGRQRMSLPGQIARRVESSKLEVVERDGESAYVSKNEIQDRPIPNLSVAFLPDGKTLVVGYEDFLKPAGIAFYDLDTGRQREDRKPPREDTGIWGDLAGVVVTPDGATLAAAGYGTVSLWDVASWTRRTHFRTGGMPPVRAVAFSHDGATLATSTDQLVQLWRVSEFR